MFLAELELQCLWGSLSWGAGHERGPREPCKGRKGGWWDPGVPAGLPAQKEEFWGTLSRVTSRKEEAHFHLRSTSLISTRRERDPGRGLLGGAGTGSVGACGLQNSLTGTCPPVCTPEGTPLKAPSLFSAVHVPSGGEEGKWPALPDAPCSSNALCLSTSLHLRHRIEIFCVWVCLPRGRVVSLETVLFTFSSLDHIRGPDTQ